MTRVTLIRSMPDTKVVDRESVVLVASRLIEVALQEQQRENDGVSVFAPAKPSSRARERRTEVAGAEAGNLLFDVDGKRLTISSGELE